MRGCKIWLAFQDLDSKETYRRMLDGYPCEIQGVTMVVHKVASTDIASRGRKVAWRVSDPYTGAKVTSTVMADKKSVIRKVKEFVSIVEQEQGKPFTEIVVELRKELGNIMDLPERKTDGV